jgi:hypothetical protein
MEHDSDVGPGGKMSSQQPQLQFPTHALSILGTGIRYHGASASRWRFRRC